MMKEAASHKYVICFITICSLFLLFPGTLKREQMLNMTYGTDYAVDGALQREELLSKLSGVSRLGRMQLFQNTF